MVITQIGRKKWWVTALVWEILCKILLKWASFARFPRGTWDEFTKVGLNRTNFNLYD